MIYNVSKEQQEKHGYVCEFCEEPATKKCANRYSCDDCELTLVTELLSGITEEHETEADAQIRHRYGV